MYYFVKLSNGKIKIQSWSMDMTTNPSFEALTQEQVDFYGQHPEASLGEVRNCKLNEPIPIDPAQSLEVHKEDVRRQISDLSLETLHYFITEYQFTNAQASYTGIQSALIEEENTVYSLERASDIIQKYNFIGKQCRDFYYTCKALIEDAEIAATVDTILANAVAFHESFKTTHPEWVYNIDNSL